MSARLKIGDNMVIEGAPDEIAEIVARKLTRRLTNEELGELFRLRVENSALHKIVEALSNVVPATPPQAESSGAALRGEDPLRGEEKR